MSARLPEPPEYFIERIRDLQRRMRDHLLVQLRAAEAEALAATGEPRDGDVIYRLDERGEAILLAACREWAREIPFVLVAEGLPDDGALALPEGSDPDRAAFRLIVDPIDGTRGLMYNKRSGWALAGVAPNRGAATSLADIEVAVQTELPTTRAAVGDILWAVRGRGAAAVTETLATGETRPFVPRPTRATDLAHGWAAIAKFFPGDKRLVAAIEEELFDRLLGPPADGNPRVFDDEYVSSGGQLYELMIGHDRFLADLRPLTYARALPAGAHRLCAHPYDLCTELIAREAGVEVVDPYGRPLAAPLDIRAPVAWVGYGNAAIRRHVEPVLQEILAKHLGEVWEKHDG